MPLLVEWPDPALGLVELAQKSKVSLVAVEPRSILQDALVEVEPVQRVAFVFCWEFQPYSLQNRPRFAPFLQETHNLVDLVRNHIPVLVLVESFLRLFLLGTMRDVISVRLLLLWSFLFWRGA